jgi:hypothetical protein
MAKLPKRVRVSFQPDLRMWSVVALGGTRAGRLVGYFEAAALADATFKARHDGKGQRCWVEGEWLPGLNDWQTEEDPAVIVKTYKGHWSPAGHPELTLGHAALVILEITPEDLPWVGAKSVSLQGEPVA